jgi:hypothetical protein
MFMNVRTLGVVVVTSAMLLLGSIAASMQPAANEPYVDGPLGPAMIQPPDPSKPIDVNEP